MDYLPQPIQPLTTKPSRELVLEHLEHFKVQAMNFALATMTNKDSKYLEPKEVKTLTDMVLNLEDSIRQTVPEGQQARAVHRLLDKYGTD